MQVPDLLQLLCVGTVLLAVYCHYRVQRLRIPNVRSPFCWPLIGNANYFINKTPPQILMQIEKLLAEFGNRIQVFLGIDSILMLANPADNEVCFVA